MLFTYQIILVLVNIMMIISSVLYYDADNCKIHSTIIIIGSSIDLLIISLFIPGIIFKKLIKLNTIILLCQISATLSCILLGILRLIVSTCDTLNIIIIMICIFMIIKMIETVISFIYLCLFIKIEGKLDNELMINEYL